MNKYVVKIKKNILLIATVIIYLFACIAAKKNMEWDYTPEVASNITGAIEMKKNSVIKYQIPSSCNEINSIALQLEQVQEGTRNGKVKIEIYDDDNEKTVAVFEKEIFQLDGSVSKWEFDNYKSETKNYSILISLQGVDTNVHPMTPIVKIGKEEQALYNQGTVWDNDILISEKLKLAVEIGGIVKEKTYAFDLMLLSGIGFFACILIRISDKGVKENEINTVIQ